MKTLARIVLTLVVIVWFALPSTDANAVSAVATGGSVYTEKDSGFVTAIVSLEGPGFSLTNTVLQDRFNFSGTPNPGRSPLDPGTMVDFTGQASLAPSDLLVFNGVSYRASGTISVTTPQAVLPSLVPPLVFVTGPFTLAGSIHGQSLSGPQTVDLSVSGSGLVAAQFGLQNPPIGQGQFNLESVTYRVGAIPEPGTSLLFVTGLAGLAAWRRMKQRD